MVSKHRKRGKNLTFFQVVHSPFDDLAALPSDVASNLKRSLNRPKDLVGESIARAFLQALVHLIGGYREALKHRQVGDD